MKLKFTISIYVFKYKVTSHSLSLMKGIKKIKYLVKHLGDTSKFKKALVIA